MELAGCAAVLIHVSGFGSVIKIKTDDRDASLHAPGHRLIAKIGRARHPFGRAVIFLVDVGAKQQTVAGLELRSDALIEVFRRNRLFRATVPYVRNHGRPDKAGDLQIVNVLATFDHVRWRVDMRACMQSHMSATHDLAEAAIGIILDDLGLELHILLETLVGSHAEFAGIEFETDVDDASRATKNERDVDCLRSGLRTQNAFIHVFDSQNCSAISQGA